MPHEMYKVLTFVSLVFLTVLRAEPPNILLILLDDVGVEAFSSYTGNPVNTADGQSIETPAIDTLSANGIRYLQAHSTPLCTPTRVQLLTGKYSYRNYRAFGYLDASEHTVAQLLRQNGYRTAIAGKWQLSWLGDHSSRHSDGSGILPTGTTEATGITPAVMRQDYGFDTYLLWYLNYSETQKGSRYWEPKIEEPSPDGMSSVEIPTTAADYGPDLFAAKIKSFITESAGDGVPFFAYYPMALPHDPWVSTPDSATTQKTVSEEEYFDDNVEYADRIVGELIDHLDDPNGDGNTGDSIRSNTLVIFTSDNGTDPDIVIGTDSGNVTGGKFSPTTRGTRVPFILNWPGTLNPSTSPRLVDFSDIAPTLLSVAGITPPADLGMDGLPLLNASGTPLANRETAYLYHKPLWGNSLPDNIVWEFAQEAAYKLYADGRFYHAVNDPDEVTDLAVGTLSPEQEAIRTSLQAELDRQTALREASPRFVNGFTRHISDSNLDGLGDARSDSLLFVGDNNANSTEYRVIFEAPLGSPQLAALRANFGGATLRGRVTHTRGTVPDIRIVAMTADENGDIEGAEANAVNDFHAAGTEVAILRGLEAGDEFVVDVSDAVLADLGQAYSSFRFEAVGIDPPNTPGADQIRLGGRYGEGTGLETALRLQLSALGDINEDGFHNAADIDAFDLAVRTGQLTARHDLDRDGTPGRPEDRVLLIENLVGVPIGDANLDGTVDLADFHLLREAYGGSGWASGDFNGDGVVSVLDAQFMWSTFAPGDVEGVDANGDGREDLLDFAHLLLPPAQAESLLPQLSLTNGHLQIRFRRINSPAISYQVQRADGLGPNEWNGENVETFGNPEPNPDGSETVTYRLAIPASQDATGLEFLRLLLNIP